jgi:hypothetical protein
MSVSQTIGTEGAIFAAAETAANKMVHTLLLPDEYEVRCLVNDCKFEPPLQIQSSVEYKGRLWAMKGYWTDFRKVEHVTLVQHQICITTTLNELDCSGMPLGIDGAVVIAAFLPKCQLHKLDLSNCKLRLLRLPAGVTREKTSEEKSGHDAGIFSLLTAVATNTKLLTVSLAGNNMGSEDVGSAVGDMLKRNTTLTNLDISSQSGQSSGKFVKVNPFGCVVSTFHSHHVCVL